MKPGVSHGLYGILWVCFCPANGTNVFFGTTLSCFFEMSWELRVVPDLEIVFLNVFFEMKMHRFSDPDFGKRRFSTHFSSHSSVGMVKSNVFLG